MRRWSVHVSLVLGATLVLLAAAAGLQAPAGAALHATVLPGSGEGLYRKYCGSCHALSAALSAGFGANRTGIAANGGPSLNNVRVPYSYTIEAITEPTGGHEQVQNKIGMAQLRKVALWLAQVTKRNPLPALPTDG